MSINIRIPSFRRVDTENEKAHTVFCIEVTISGKALALEKRYSEFEELHKKLKRAIPTPPLPPKSVMKWNQKVLEQRRLGLEAYLQGVIEGGSVPRSLLNFLQVQHIPQEPNKGSMDSLDQLESSPDIPVMSHQPVIAFSEIFSSQQQIRGYLPDIITQGVVQGLYGSADDLR